MNKYTQYKSILYNLTLTENKARSFPGLASTRPQHNLLSLVLSTRSPLPVFSCRQAPQALQPPELACLPSPLVSPTAQLGDAYKLAPGLQHVLFLHYRVLSPFHKPDLAPRDLLSHKTFQAAAGF